MVVAEMQLMLIIATILAARVVIGPSTLLHGRSRGCDGCGSSRCDCGGVG